MKILLLSRYGYEGASSRYRSLLYLSYLRSHGVEIEVEPLLSDEYVLRMYRGDRLDVRDLLSSYMRRISALRRKKAFDLLWIEYEAFPWIPALVESMLVGSSVPYVVDYDDAVFHRYDRSSSIVVRAFLGSKIDRVMRNASVVIAGNGYLASRAATAGARNVEILPTIVDEEKYVPAPDRGKGRFTIVWIGSPSTARYLGLVESAMAEVQRSGAVRIVIVGVRKVDLAQLSFDLVPFSEENEIREMWNADVGIMPLEDSPWERGKCGHKLIKYMACGLPVIASPVGVNEEIVDHGLNGFLAKDARAWVDLLNTLRQDPALARRMGQEGRKKVEEQYSTRVAAPRLLQILRSAAQRQLPR